MSARRSPPAGRRASWILAGSALAHLAVLVVVLSQRPSPPLPIGETVPPPDQAIQVVLMSRRPPEPARHAPPANVLRLHRPLIVAPNAPTAPIAPPAPNALPADVRGPVALHPSPLPEGPKADVRAALRQGTVGCGNRQAVGLTRAEREHCDEVFGKGAKDTAFAGLGLDPEKLRLLEAAGAQKEADYRYKHSQIPGAVSNKASAGASAEQMCHDMGVPPDECGMHIRR